MIQTKKRSELQSTVPGNSLSVKVIDRDIVKALRQFKRKVKEAGIIESVNSRREYEKKSVKNRKIRNSARYKQKNNQHLD